MRAHEFLNDDIAQPLGSVPNLPCACATKRGAKRKPLPSLVARRNAVQPIKHIKPKSPVQPVATSPDSLRNPASSQRKPKPGPSAARA
jgi:hypothetical protein